LAGRQSGSRADTESDYDIYVFTTSDIPLLERRALAERFDPNPEIGNTWFGPGDEWTDVATGTSVDLMYWDRNGFEDQSRDVIERHRPSLGYSTSLWFTLKRMVSLFDGDGWLARMNTLAKTPYPDELQRAIVTWNRPLLRTTQASYRHQLEIAIQRDDPVSVNHRVTALLASIFDIVFAVGKTQHPGEKRQLAYVAQIADIDVDPFMDGVLAVLHATAEPSGDRLLQRVDQLCDLVDRMIAQADLAQPSDV
jgi:hypothetical protein